MQLEPSQVIVCKSTFFAVHARAVGEHLVVAGPGTEDVFKHFGVGVVRGVAAYHVGVGCAHVAIGTRTAADAEAAVCRLGFLKHVTVVSIKAHPAPSFKTVPTVKHAKVLLIVGHGNERRISILGHVR